MIEVFPVVENFTSWPIPFMPIAIALLTAFFLIYMLVAALKMFEGVPIEKKVVHFIVIGILITLWPTLVIHIKLLVDSFNTFLIQRVFNMDWDQGIGISRTSQLAQAVDWGWDIHHWPLKVLNAVLAALLIAANTLIYWLFLLMFFLYVALGPLIIARSIFGEELEGVVDLLREVTTLFLWQSTFVILVGFLDTGYAATSQFVEVGDSILMQAGRGIALIVLILFVPLITRKIVGEVSSSIAPATSGGGAYGFALGALATHRPTLALPILTGHGLKAEVVRVIGKRFVRLGHKTGETQKLQKAEREVKRLRTETVRLEQEQEEAVLHSEPEPPSPPSTPRSEVDTQRPKVEFQQVEETQTVDERRPQKQRVEVDVHRGKHETHTKTTRKRKGSFDILQGLFIPKGQSKKDDRRTNRLKLLRQQALLVRGPIGSDKYNDLAKVGIDHGHYGSSDHQTVQSYRDHVDRFHKRHGWLYDYEGHYVGPPHMRPSKGKSE